MLTQAQLFILRDELLADPLTLGYAESDWGQAEADLINNASGANPRTVDHKTVDTGDVRGVTTFDAFEGLTASEEAWFSWLTQNGDIPVNSDTLQNLAGIGGTSRWAVADRPIMEPRMAALMQFAGSRAEELFGEGTQVSGSDVGAAENLIVQ